eukprot:GILI01004162.1.p1 GENE.GILI01004162.1~~GILI01004162.1.p1  ORF type:complete len:580 (+),score=220.15 GILI01004162.1:95-1834(+)
MPSFNAEERANLRRSQFKKTADLDESRRKREEQTVQLRKNKREESMMKRRQVSAVEGEEMSETAQQLATMANSSQRVATLVAMIRDGDMNVKLEAVTEFRKMLSIEKNPPIQEVIESGIAPAFVAFLAPEFDQFWKVQFESAWALTNIASGTSTQTRYVVSIGVIPAFVRLLDSQEADVVEQAIWGLGNISGDGAELRDSILSNGGAMKILAAIQKFNKLSLVRNATWTLSNLCRGKPFPSMDLIRPIIPYLCHCVLSLSDDDVVTDALWALSYITEGCNTRISAVLEVAGANLAAKVVQFLDHERKEIVIPSLRLVGNIVSGDEDQTQLMVDSNCVPALTRLLENPRRNIRKEACWSLSNITAGSAAQIQKCIEALCFPALVRIMSNAEFEVRKEAIHAIGNATSGTEKQIKYLAENGVIAALCESLTQVDGDLVLVCLTAIENILQSGEKVASKGNGYNPYLEDVEQYGIDAIENLQSHEKTEIYEKASSIIEKYFNGEDDEEYDEEESQQNNGFAFSSNGNENVNPNVLNQMANANPSTPFKELPRPAFQSPFTPAFGANPAGFGAAPASGFQFSF